MKKRYSVTVAFTNLENGLDIEFNSYNDAVHFAHAVYKSPECYGFDIWELLDSGRWVCKYAKTNCILGF
jgi:hypothetical protein